MRLLRCLPVIVVMGLLFFLSSLPGTSITMPNIVSFDKLLHTFAYGVLAAAALLAAPEKLRRKKPRLTALLIVFFCLLYGVSDELHQSFVPHRDTSGLDLAADTVGAAITVLMWLSTARKNSVLCKEHS